MKRRLFRLWLLAALVSTTANAQQVQVSVWGAVQRPGPRTLPADGRLADAVLAAMPTQQAYPLGAGLFRQDAVAAQARLKAGLLYDLDQLADGHTETPALAEAAARLRAWLAGRPVTGRVTLELEARRLELDLDANRLLADGDRFVYPLRPATVRVAGAVLQDCTLPHVPLRDARAYLRDCQSSPAADPDQLYVVQPDGRVTAIGIAVWNRSPPQALAPGATLYVPLSERRLRTLDHDPDFNREFAAFIATQPLPAPGALP